MVLRVQKMQRNHFNYFDYYNNNNDNKCQGKETVFSAESSDTDVLLVSKEGGVVPCHSSILAIGSPLLRSILNKRQTEEEIIRIIFNDVKQIHLNQLIQYFYTGAVEVSSEDKRELSVTMENLLVHKTSSGGDDQIKEETEYCYEQEENANSYYFNYEDDLISKCEIEEYEIKPCRILLTNFQTKKTKRKYDEDKEWRPKFNARVDDDEDFKNFPKTPKIKHCDYCDFFSESFPKLSKHVHSEHAANVTEFESKNSLNQECNYCEQKFKTLLKLKKHVQTEHEEYFEQFKEQKQISCKVCDEKFFNLGLKRQHEKDVHNMKVDKKKKQDVLCPVCAYHAPHRKGFSKHKMLWHKEVPSPCGDCNEMFNSRWDLKTHMQEVHQRKYVRLNMNNKARQFSPKEDKVGEFYCEFCGKGFHSEKQYKTHVRNHKQELDCKCRYCDKIGNKYAIERHEKLHFDPTIPCETCGKLFHHITNLSRHIRMSHLPDSMKKHICTFCGKGFDEKTKLNDHFNVHTGAKPYKCRFCDMAYQNKSNRQAHERKAHGIMTKKKIGKVGTDIKTNLEQE